jgi:hypothetical protein
MLVGVHDVFVRLHVRSTLVHDEKADERVEKTGLLDEKVQP